MNLLSSKIQNINKLHEMATISATEAIHYAKELGRLLLEVKSEIPYGEFTGWIEANLTVSTRQAQRYMATASGKDLKFSELGHKNDMMSVLSQEQVMEKYHNPTWIPSIGRWHTGIQNKSAFWIVPYKNNEDFFHITAFHPINENLSIEDEGYDSTYSGSIKPIHHLSIDASLHFYGLDYPDQIDWFSYEEEGLLRPFAEPNALSHKYHPTYQGE